MDGRTSALKARARATDMSTVLLGCALALSLLTVVLAGGRLGALAEVRFHAAGLVVAALGLQILIVSVVPGAGEALTDTAHLASYALMAAWVWLNRRTPGVAIIGLGGLLNAVAIAANGGVMPADPEALALAGQPQVAGEFDNSAVVEGARLAFLGDVFAVPASWPVANVFSVGDVIIAAGAFWGLHRLCGSRLGRRLGPRPAGAPSQPVATG